MHQWNESDIIELCEERAAIMEFDGGMDRKKAERAAYFDVRKLIGLVEIPDVIKNAVRLGNATDVQAR